MCVASINAGVAPRWEELDSLFYSCQGGDMDHKAAVQVGLKVLPWFSRSLPFRGLLRKT